MLAYRNVVGLFVGLAVLISACSQSAPPAAKKQLELELVSHVTAELPEQDVYVVKPSEADGVYRIEATEAAVYMAAPLYAATEVIEHDPFALGETPLGPYPKGSDLGFTMEEWLAGTGRGTYTVDGDQAELDLAFEKLVPNAVYTVWCATIHLPPNFKIIDEPCGAGDGSENSFVTNPEGKAKFHLHLPVLSDSTDEVLKSIAIAYHSNGQTYGANPGDFGLNSHVQLFFGLPGSESEAWQVVSDVAVAEAR